MTAALSAPLTWALPAAILLLALAMVLTLLRMLHGPTAQDRVLALDCMYLNGMLLVLVLAMHYASEVYFETALLIALFRRARCLRGPAWLLGFAAAENLLRTRSRPCHHCHHGLLAHHVGQHSVLFSLRYRADFCHLINCGFCGCHRAHFNHFLDAGRPVS